MFKHLISWSVAHPWLVVGITVLLLGLSWNNMSEMQLDVFPELNAPTVTIMTESPGLAADEVEQYVSVPIEAAVNGIPGARRVRSSSAISLSIVWVEFDFGMDIYRARQLVSERLDTARESLPEGAHAEITPLSGIAGEIMLLAISSPDGTATPLELRSYAEFELRKALLGVPGIAQAVAIGGAMPEFTVSVSPERLREWNLTFEDVLAAVRESDSPATAGYLPDHEGRELPIRLAARVRTPEQIRSTLVATRGNTPITVGMVADVELAGAPARGSASVAATPAVVVSVQKSPGTNTLALTQSIDALLDQIEPSMPPGAKLHRHVVRQSDFISLSLDNLMVVLRDAAIFVAIVLIMFLLNVRTTVITLAALPVSLAVGLLVLWVLGLGINVMTLGGLAVAIGELVDDAIIDVENVYRRLRENAVKPPEQRLPAWQVVISGSNEIRSSVVFATVIIVLVFVPLLFLGGLEGRFFQPLGIAYISSILASLLVALTLTPALCRILLSRIKVTPGKSGHGDGVVVRLIKRAYLPTLKLAIRMRWIVMALAVVLTASSLWLASTFGTQFLPTFNEGTFTVFLMAPPGTSLVESTRLATGVERKMAAIEGVREVVRRTGRAERDEHAEPVSSSEIEVTLHPGTDQERVRRELDAILGGIPGITTMIGQPIEHRLSHLLSGTPAAIAISIYGEDLDQLRAAAQDVEAALQRVSGARDISANREVTIDTLPVEFDRYALAMRGLTPAGAAQQVSQAFLGAHAGTLNDGSRRYDMVVRLGEEERMAPNQVADFQLRSNTGELVRLREVARTGIERASNLIVHENGRRKAVVSLNVADGYNLGHLVTQVKLAVDPVLAERGLTAHYGGQFEAQQSASRTITTMGAGVAIVILMLLSMAFGGVRPALLVMVNLPLALIGGIAAVFLTSGAAPLTNAAALFGLGEAVYRAPVISVASMVGFVTLFGIAVRNGILLVNHYIALEAQGLPRSSAVLQGSLERLTPILMTALTAVLGLLPLALAAGKPGSELLAPLAVVVLGGLVTSTFLNLVVIPAAWEIFMGRHPAGGAPAPDGELAIKSNDNSNPVSEEEL